MNLKPIRYLVFLQAFTRADTVIGTYDDIRLETVGKIRRAVFLRSGFVNAAIELELENVVRMARARKDD